MEETPRVKGQILCPWCQKGKVVVNWGDNSAITVACRKCGRFGLYDIKSMTATKSKAVSNSSIS